MFDFGKKFILVKNDFSIPKYYTESGTWSIARSEAKVYQTRKEAIDINATICDMNVRIVETKG